MYLKHPRSQATFILKEGDVVLVKENLPRGRWKVGKSHQLIKGQDQMIRSAKVLILPNKFFHRTLNLLYPIESRDSVPGSYWHSKSREIFSR